MRRIILLTVAVVLPGAHFFLSRLPPSQASPLLFLDRLFDILLATTIVSLSAAVGLWVNRLLSPCFERPPEQLLFATGIGLGILAYATLALALIGAIYPWTLILLLGLLALAARGEWTHLARLLREAWTSREPLGPLEKCITALLLALLLLSLLRALTPPTDYDGLMYHLTAPQTFLREHRLVSFDHNPGANFPATTEMLYAIALGLGSPMAAKVLHLSFGLLTTLALFCLARHFLGREAAWLSIAVLWSIPVFVTEAGWAYVDLAWTFYETLAIFAFLLWTQRLNRGWLIFSALFMGFALGTKYVALYGFLLLVVAIATVGWVAHRRGLQGVAKDLLLFGVVSGLVASPWYLKNWLWLGNPIYPFFIGGLNYGPHQVEATAYLARNRGLGHCLRCYLLLPWNIYTRSEHFGHVHPAWPSPLYLLLPFWVLWRMNRIVNLLLALSFVRFALWAVSTQDLRYLLPIYPILSVATAYILGRATGPGRFKQLRRSMITVLALLVMLLSLKVQTTIEDWSLGNTLPVVLGLESQVNYLGRNLIDYPATEFINDNLPLDAEVLLIGDARGYYLRRQYIPDTTIHLWWGYLVPVGGSLEGILAQLKEWGVSHILYSEGGVEWVSRWDPEGRAERGAELFASFKERYLVELYKDNAKFHVYRIVY